MKNKKMKKIIFEATTIMLVTFLLAVNVQAETKKNPIKQENDSETEYNYLIFGKGYIFDINMNGTENKYGKIHGDLHITNEKPAWNAPTAPDEYKLFVFDKNTHKLLTNSSLPEKFTLQGFVGFGYFEYYWVPHYIDATKFFIVGKAVAILT